MRPCPDVECLFLAGVPGAGKTSLGNWLAREKGFFHLDMEDWPTSAQELHTLWDNYLGGAPVAPFVAGIRALGKRTVLTWGFPPEFLPCLQAFHQIPAKCWWLDAPRHLARASWSHPDQPTATFDQQFDRIEATRSRIANFFSPRILPVFDPSERHRSLDILAAAIGIT